MDDFERLVFALICVIAVLLLVIAFSGCESSEQAQVRRAKSS